MLFCSSFFPFYMILIDIHVFVCAIKQFSHCTSGKIAGQCKACCIAQGSIRIHFGFLSHISAHLFKALCHLFPVQSMGNRKKFISTCSSHKLLSRHGSPQADGKSTDIGITSFMSSAVINAPEIIKIKTADTGICIRFCLTQQFFTFIFVRKSCRIIQIYFALQQAVHCSILYCFDELISNQQHQHNNICCDIFLKQ